MSEEKRMLGNYEVVNSIYIGDKEVVFGVDKSDKSRLPLPQGLKSSTLKALRGLPPPMSLTCPLWAKRRLRCSLSFPTMTRASIFL